MLHAAIAVFFAVCATGISCEVISSSTIATVSRTFFEKEKDRIDAHSVRFDVGPFPFVLSPSPLEGLTEPKRQLPNFSPPPSFLPIKRPFWSRWALSPFPHQALL